jgi:FkbM family methyltransferase
MKTEHLAWLTRRIAGLKGGYRASRILIDRHLNKRRPLIESDVMGFRMLLDPQEFVDQSLLFHPQTYEAAELEYVRSHLHPGDTLVDIGAHIGLYSLLASVAVGESGHVVAVEAATDTFARLVLNLLLNGVANVQAYNYGVSDESGSLPLYRWIGRGPNAAADTLIPRNHPGDEWVISGRVPCLTLLEVLSLAGIKNVTGLKLDIERAEYKVLNRFFAEAPESLLPSFILLEEYESTIQLAGGSAVKLLDSSGTYRRLANDALKRDHIFELGGD